MGYKKKNNVKSQYTEVEGTEPDMKKSQVELSLAMNASMWLNTGNNQHMGARSYQEDSFGYSNIIDSSIVSDKGMFAVLSDGMGGLSNGKAVSDYVVKSSITMFDTINPRAGISEQLKNLIGYVNKNVCDQYLSEDGMANAGATMVLAYIFKNRIYWATAGDSRLYCLRKGHLMQMNEDHDYKNQLLREYIRNGGSLERIEAEPQKDSLVSFIGHKDLPYTDVSLKGYKILPGDIFVLCSDGIYNFISRQRLTEILIYNDAQTACDKIVSEIAQACIPGQDNMTIMVIKCEKNF